MPRAGTRSLHNGQADGAESDWLRCTAATLLLDNGASLRFVSKLLRQSSQVTTSRIYDPADRIGSRCEVSSNQAVNLLSIDHAIRFRISTTDSWRVVVGTQY